MKKKISIILISLVFILTSFSGCTEFDGDDGFFDWLAEDGAPEGGYDSCYAYGYVTITVLDPEGPEGNLITLYYGNSNNYEKVGVYDCPGDGHLEDIYLGNVKIDKYGNKAMMMVYITDKQNDTKLPYIVSRQLDFETASSGGTEDTYTWKESFYFTVD
jgi:hypothetical protein